MTEFRFAGTDVKAWPTAADGEAIVANRWVESHLPITSIDEANHVVHFGKRSVFLLEPGDRYWIENVKENLSGAGRVLRRSAREGRLPDPARGRRSEHGAGHRASPRAGAPARGQAGRGPVRRARRVPGTGIRPRGMVLRPRVPRASRTRRSPPTRSGASSPTRPTAASARRPSACRVPSGAGAFAPARSRTARSRTSAPTASSLPRAARTTASATASSPTWAPAA